MHPAAEFPKANEGLLNNIEFTPYMDAQSKNVLNIQQAEFAVSSHPQARTGEVPLLLAQDEEDQETNYMHQIGIENATEVEN